MMGFDTKADEIITALYWYIHVRTLSQIDSHHVGDGELDALLCATLYETSRRGSWCVLCLTCGRADGGQ